MAKNLIVVVIFIISLIGSIESQQIFKPQGDLLYVVEAFRHGARYTIYEQFWDGKNQSDNAGELSPTGIRQQYTFGQMLRAEYIEKRGFLDKTYNHNQINISSTDVNRTLMSAYSQLQGLYPPGTGPYVSNNISNLSCLLPPYKGSQQPQFIKGYENQSLPQLIQVVPVMTEPPQFNPILSAEQMCNNTAVLQAQFENTTQYVNQINTYYNTTYLNLQKVVNYSQPINFSNIENLYDVLIADLYNGRALPIGMTNELWNNLTALDSLWWAVKYGGSKQVSQLINSNLLQDILAQFDAKIKGDLPLNKWRAYSAHDSNIAPLMYALGIFDINCTMNKFTNYTYPTNLVQCFNRPAYVANFLIELYNQSGNYTVALRYEGEYVSPNNSQYLQISLQDFKNFLNSTLNSFSDWSKLCTSPSPKQSDDQLYQEFREIYNSVDEGIQERNQRKSYSLSKTLSIILGVVLAVQFLVSAKMLYNKYKNKKYYSNFSQELDSSRTYQLNQE